MPDNRHIIRSTGTAWVAVPSETGALRLFRHPQQHWQDRYVIGCAIAGDACCAEVFDRVGFGPKYGKEIPEIAGEVHGAMTIPRFAAELRALCAFYSPDPRCISIAMVCPIANEGGLGLLDQFSRMQLPFLRLIRRKEGPDKPGTTYVERWGFVLNQGTKEAFFSEMLECVTPETFTAPDEVWSELQAIGRNEQQNFDGTATSANLRVLALGAAIQGHHQAARASISPSRLLLLDADYRTDKVDEVDKRGYSAYKWGGVRLQQRPKDEGVDVTQGWFIKE